MFNLFSSWQFLIAVSILAISFSTLLQKMLLRDEESDPIAYSIIFQFLVAVIIGIYTLFVGFHLPNLTTLWWNMILMTVLYALANIFTFTGIQLIEASEFTVLFTTRSLWTILTASLFLGEHFLLIQFVGVFLIFLSVILVNFKQKKFVFNKGVVFAFLGAAAIGIAFVNDAYIVRSSDIASYETIAFFLPALLLLLFYPKSVKHFKRFSHMPTLLKMLAFSGLYAVGAFTLYSAYAIARNASALSAISQLITIITVLLAVVFLKETTGILKKIVAAVIAFIGVVLIGK